MKNFKIALGTTSKQKIKYLDEVLEELNIKAKVTSVKVKSGIVEQPKTTKETEKGSISRALKALKKIKGSDFAIGIEIGYHKNKSGNYEMFCWVTIIDKHGCQISKRSHKLLLPKYHQKLLNSDIFMGDNLDGYLKDENLKNSFAKRMDEIIRYRRPFIKNALENALTHYLDKKGF